MRNKKRNRVLFLLILLLGIGIGFAALATTLKINGNATITKNTWNIYWDNIANESGVTPETPTAISNEDSDHQKNIVTFEVTFDKPGDFYEFEVDAVNAGTLDAEILSIEKKYNNTLIPVVEDPEHRVVPAYLKYEVTYADTGEPAVGDKLLKRTDATHFTTKTYKIRVEYDKDAVTNSDINDQDDDVTHSFTLAVEYGQANEPTSPWTLPQGRTAETLALGDELCIKDQCFNFVRYDENGDTVLLAKWNLNVGSSPKGGTETFIQDSEVRGDWNDNGTMRDYGRVMFGTSSYWYDFDNYVLKSKYGSSFPATIYDPDLDGNPGTQTYSIAYYVKRYKTILEGAEYGATIKTARLLLHEEAKGTLGCPANPDLPQGPCTTTGDVAFVTNTDYWLGTAYNYYYLYRVNFGSMSDEGAEALHGVRPVIVVEKSNL